MTKHRITTSGDLDEVLDNLVRELKKVPPWTWAEQAVTWLARKMR